MLYLAATPQAGAAARRPLAGLYLPPPLRSSPLLGQAAAPGPLWPAATAQPLQPRLPGKQGLCRWRSPPGNTAQERRRRWLPLPGGSA